MGMAGTLVLIANPGSASRKYGLYEGSHMRATLHVETTGDRVTCTISQDGKERELHTGLYNVADATGQVVSILREAGALAEDEQIEKIGVRIVAPGGFFLADRQVDDDVMGRLEALRAQAPLHIEATLGEIYALREQFPDTPLIGISDSGFHITKPEYAWNYGIPLHDSDYLDIKRFGYHGLSIASAVRALEEAEKLPPKLIVCHIGSGISVTAVHGGKSLDTSMGYSPLEGPIMATRSGSLDFVAARALKEAHGMDDAQLDEYLHTKSGLLGIGGSSDVRELLGREADGDHYAWLALKTYVYNLQKTIGQMAAALGGADALVFTGTVGERSASIRHRIVQRLHYLDFFLDEHANAINGGHGAVRVISHLGHSKPLYIVPADESGEMARRLGTYEAS